MHKEIYYTSKEYSRTSKLMLLKFWNRNGNIVLDSPKAELLDITSDMRTGLLNKDEMIVERFKVAPGVFFLKKPFFILMAKKQNRESIEALQIKYKGNNIIVTGDKSYVFYEGKAVNVEEYGLIVDEAQGVAIASQ